LCSPPDSPAPRGRPGPRPPGKLRVPSTTSRHQPRGSRPRPKFDFDVNFLQHFSRVTPGCNLPRPRIRPLKNHAGEVRGPPDNVLSPCHLLVFYYVLSGSRRPSPASATFFRELGIEIASCEVPANFVQQTRPQAANNPERQAPGPLKYSDGAPTPHNRRPVGQELPAGMAATPESERRCANRQESR
jgi:hypothetical protein